jgi:hypothetical protein
MSNSVHADFSPIISGRFKFNSTLNQGKESVITTEPDIIAGMNAGASLPNQYCSGINTLTGITFNTQSLRLTIPTVTGTPTTFFMSHFPSPLFRRAGLLSV